MLSSRSNSLLAQRAINRGQANSLTKQLQQISKLILSGKINGAVNNLTSFISGVNDLVCIPRAGSDPGSEVDCGREWSDRNSLGVSRDHQKRYKFGRFKSAIRSCRG